MWKCFVHGAMLLPADLSLPGSVPAAVEVEPETGISNTEMATSLEEKAVGGGDEEEEDAGAGEHAPTLHVQPPEEDIAPVVFEPQVHAPTMLFTFVSVTSAECSALPLSAGSGCRG